MRWPWQRRDSGIELEFRLSAEHVGEGRISARAPIQHVNPYWSYARHLPINWDQAERRTAVATQLLLNLQLMSADSELDLSPLLNDQRVSGRVLGDNPLQNTYDLMVSYAEEHPRRRFYGKWGGGKPWLAGKGVAMYVEDKQEAQQVLAEMNAIAATLRIPVDLHHQYGIIAYADYVDLDDRLRSPVRNPAGFQALLEGLQAYPHFAHELFRR